ncbi:MAG: hypothetical protein RIR66_949 [Actinomycetota bacterium]|jgi:drug/metabolite transporter (DMT)-like permease
MVVFSRWSYDAGMNPASFLFLRFGIAAICLWAIVYAKGLKLPSRNLSFKALGMGTMYVGNAGAYFVALTMAPPAVVAMLFYLYPAFVAILAFFILHERINLKSGLAMILAIVGAAFTIGFTIQSGSALGTFLAILSGVVYSAFLVIGRKWSDNIDPLVRTALVTTSATGVFAIASIFFGFDLPTNALGWVGVLCISLISTVFAITALLAGLRYVKSTHVATLSATEPVVAAIASATVLGQSLTSAFIVGAAMIVASALIIAND